VSVEIDSGCIYISGAVEFDDRPGPVRDALVSMVRDWQSALERAIRLAIDERHLQAATPVSQVLFEIHGLILALHHDARFLRNVGAVARARAGYERTVRQHATAAGRSLVGAAVKSAPTRARRPPIATKLQES
jgi:hypothetical protein